MADLIKLYIKKFVGTATPGDFAFDMNYGRRCIVRMGVNRKLNDTTIDYDSINLHDYLMVNYDIGLWADYVMVLKRDLIRIKICGRSNIN